MAILSVPAWRHRALYSQVTLDVPGRLALPADLSKCQKRGDKIFAYSVSKLRGDRRSMLKSLPSSVILRSAATKNLVHEW